MKNLKRFPVLWIYLLAVCVTISLHSCDSEDDSLSLDDISSQEKEIVENLSTISDVFLEKEDGLSKTSNSRSVTITRPLITLHKHDRFEGKKILVCSTNLSSSRFGAPNLGNFNFNDITSSIVVPAGCDVTLYEHSNYTGNSMRINNKNGYSAVYYRMNDVNRSGSSSYGESISNSGLNDKFSSILIEVNLNLNLEGSFMGWAKKGHRSKSSLPIFFDTPLSENDLNHFTWNNNIESISFSPHHTRGSVIALTDGHVGLNHVHSGFDSTKSDHMLILEETDSNLESWNNKSSSILPAGEYNHTDSHRVLFSKVVPYGTAYREGMFSHGNWAIQLTMNDDNFLQRHEDIGGHTMARHVGQTNDDLKDRLTDCSKCKIATTFEDVNKAETFIDKVLNESFIAIKNWLNDVNANKTKAFDYQFNESTGSGFKRDSYYVLLCNDIEEVDKASLTKVRVVMRKKNVPGLLWGEKKTLENVFILTAYPTTGDYICKEDEKN